MALQCSSIHGSCGKPWWHLDRHSVLLHWLQSFLHTGHDQAKLVILKFRSTSLFLPLLQSCMTRTRAKGKTSVFSSKNDKLFLLLLTQSVTKNSGDLKKNPYQSCIDASRKMKSIFHLAYSQLLKEHNTTLMWCQECGNSSAEVLGWAESVSLVNCQLFLRHCIKVKK